MAVQRFAGFVYTGAGVAVNGATIDIFTRNTLTAAVTVPAAPSTDANGYWSATVAVEGRYDVRITNGTSISWLKYDDELQIEGIEVAILRVRNPADTFDYDIVSAAITADRQLNLPLITGTDTLATLGLAQTFTGIITFSAASGVVISGATGNTLVVDTSTFVVDATNNRVGINTASPRAGTALHVFDSSGASGFAQILLEGSAANRGAFISGGHSVANTHQLNFSVNRDGQDGTFLDSGAAHAHILINAEPSLSYIVFRAGNTNNAQGAERWRMTGGGPLTSLGAAPTVVTAAGAILAGGGIAMTDVANAWIDDASQGTGTVTHYIGNQTITTASDMRIKELLNPTGVVLERLCRLPVWDFRWNDPTETALVNRNSRGIWTGVTAQDLVKEFPFAVNTQGHGDCPDCREGKPCEHFLPGQPWVADYAYLVPTLIKAIQELTARVQGLER